MLITSGQLVIFLNIDINKMLIRGDKMNVKNLKVYKGCLIVVDMVKGFTDEGVLHDKNIRKIIPRQIELIKDAKSNNYAIVFIKDTHTKDSVEFERFGNTTHCLEGDLESELVDELQEFEYEKDTYSFAKNSTSFMESLEFRDFVEKQQELVDYEVVGCCTDICVVNGTIGLANYLDQNNREHNIIVHEDAIATYAEEDRSEYVNAAKLLMKQQGIQLIKKK